MTVVDLIIEIKMYHDNKEIILFDKRIKKSHAPNHVVLSFYKYAGIFLQMRQDTVT